MGCPAPLFLKCWVLPIRHPGRLSNCRLRRDVLLTGGQSKSFLFTSYKRWVALTDDAYVFVQSSIFMIPWFFGTKYFECSNFHMKIAIGLIAAMTWNLHPCLQLYLLGTGTTALFFYLLKNNSPVSCVCRLGCCTTHLKPSCTVNYTLI